MAALHVETCEGHELGAGADRCPVADDRGTQAVEGGRDARYLSSGHIVYASNGVLCAVPFDAHARGVTGGPVSLVEGVGDAVPPQALPTTALARTVRSFTPA